MGAQKPDGCKKSRLIKYKSVTARQSLKFTPGKEAEKSRPLLYKGTFYYVTQTQIEDLIRSNFTFKFNQKTKPLDRLIRDWGEIG